jgi:hypothetical protein
MLPKVISYIAISLLPFSLMADLKLSDFEGTFISYSQMLSLSAAHSITHLSHLTFDGEGNGIINFDSSSLEAAPVGLELKTATSTAGTARSLAYRIEITDAVHNCGKFILCDLNQGTELYSDFIAIKSKEKVIEIYQSVTGNSGPALGVTGLIFCKRIY